MKTRDITLLAILGIFSIALGMFSIPVIGTSLQIRLSFIISMFVGATFGLKECIAYGVFIDLVSFLFTNQGDPFFIGYTISSVLGLMIYWFFLHKEVNLSNIILVKLTVNLLVNVVIGSIWRTILYSNGYVYYLGVSFVKNLTMLPIEVFIFYLFYRICKKVFER